MIGGAQLGLTLDDDDIIDVNTSELAAQLADRLYELRQLHGLTPIAAASRIHDPTIFGLMLVRDGRADGLSAAGPASTPTPSDRNPTHRSS